jgi:RNA polymerase sigma factor (sigma-70 family)
VERDAQQLLRDLAPRVLSSLVRRYHDLGACEDALQEALIAAARQWPLGLPENPRAWLTSVAIRRIVDHVRAETSRRLRESIVVSLVPPEEQLALAADDALAAARDDTLDLFFMCCHPSLTGASAIALTLRAIGGLTTAEIARAFLVPEATMAQRLSRARQTIKNSGMAFEALTPADYQGRLGSVMHVLYLIFSEGYSASSGPDLRRVDLSTEALRLVRLLRRLLPQEPEVAGLLSLMLLTDARRDARTGPAGELIPLDQQDRGRWHRSEIDEGTTLITETFARGAVGPYQVQAAIAALHDAAPSTDATDWQEIANLYSLLLRMQDNPMVALSHAIAFSMVHGPAAGLERLAELERDARLAGQHRLDAARGHLLERVGDRPGAIAAYLRAAARTASSAERDYLMLQAAKLRDAVPK